MRWGCREGPVLGGGGRVYFIFYGKPLVDFKPISIYSERLRGAQILKWQESEAGICSVTQVRLEDAYWIYSTDGMDSFTAIWTQTKQNFLRFLLMWTIFKVFIEFVTILFLFYALFVCMCFFVCLFVCFWPRGMWDLSFPTMDWIYISHIGRWSFNHWTTREVPK